MQRVSRAELEELAPEWDEVVAGDAEIDPFCSRSAWQLSFHEAFEPERPLLCARSARSFVLLAETSRPAMPGMLEPLENMWGFGSPLVGDRAAAVLGDALLDEPRPVLLLGLPIDRRWLQPLADRLGGRFVARALEPTIRYVARLDGGLDAWLGRRAPAFRRNVRAAGRRAREAGVSFRRIPTLGPGEVDALYRVVLDVESRSWKAATGRGVDEGPMRAFYACLWRRLAALGQLRVLLAECDGRPVGYLHGACVDGRFRGLQFSFDDAFRSVGLGNVLQLEMLRWLCKEGVREYDLGAHSEYKARWAEAGLATMGLLVQPVSR